MPRRPRQRSGSITISRENATTTMVRRRVLNTYSRVCPRQPVNRHHFLTPDTPLMEEMELPSHLLMDSTGEGVRDETPSQMITPVPTSANSTLQRHNEQKDVEKIGNDQSVSSSKKPKLDISNTDTGDMMESHAEDGAVCRGTAAKERKRRKQPVRRRNKKQKASRQPRRVATPTHAERVELEAVDARTDIVVGTLADRPQLKQDDTMRDVPATVAGQSAQDHHTHVSYNLEPVSMEMTCETTTAGRTNSVRQSLMAQAPTPPISATKTLHMSDPTSKKLKLFLETIATELCHAGVGNSSGFQDCQGPADVTLNTVTPYDEDISEQSVVGNPKNQNNRRLESDSSNHIPQSEFTPKIDSNSYASSINTYRQSQKSYSENHVPRTSLILRSHSKHYTPETKSNSCGTLGSNSNNQALKSDSEDEIEVLRKRDRYESADDVVFSANKYLPPLEFSTEAPSRLSFTTKGDAPTILECMDESTPTTALRKSQARKRAVRPLRVDLASLCSGVEPGSSLQHRNTISASKDSDSKSTVEVRTSKRKLPCPKSSDSQEKRGMRPSLPGSNSTSTPGLAFKNSPAQKGRGSGKRNGRGSSSNSTLEEHFSGLQLTPITCPAPLPEAPPTTRTLAPLTSTPLGVSSKTAPKSSPRSVCGLVSLECTPVLNTATATTPFLNGYNSAYPMTSTPIDPRAAIASNPACPLGEASNVRKCGTPGGSWVGSTMARLLEFDEIGFEASEGLDFSHAQSVEQHNTRSKAAQRRSNSRANCTPSPRSVARSSPSKRLQQRQKKRTDHSRKTESKPACSKSAKWQNKPVRETAGRQRPSTDKMRQKHSEGRAAGKRRRTDNTDTKSKRVQSTEKRAPRGGSTPTPSAEQGTLNLATTGKRRKKRRCIVPLALKKRYNKNKGMAGNSNSSSSVTGIVPRNKCSPPNAYDKDAVSDPVKNEDHPICILVRLSKAAGTTHHGQTGTTHRGQTGTTHRGWTKFQNSLSNEESIQDDILCA